MTMTILKADQWIWLWLNFWLLSWLKLFPSVYFFAGFLMMVFVGVVGVFLVTTAFCDGMNNWYRSSMQ
ncbi:hypothetical protein [Klebsiella pneumoniae]|uniref:hypothetical protein n=1 Tax=Klebsiella pneumoniae TaxID=573 RepID=UPI0039E97609